MANGSKHCQTQAHTHIHGRESEGVKERTVCRPVDELRRGLQKQNTREQLDNLSLTERAHISKKFICCINKMNTRGKKLQIVQRSMYDVNAKICRLVSQNPCLFDRSDPNFQKQNVVQDVWKHIGEEMNLLAKTCQQRWVNMRATYIRSLRGHPEGSTYYLTNDIQFLYEHITPLPPKARRSRVSGLEEDRKPKVEAKPKVWHAQSPNGDEPEYVGTSFEEDSKYGTARKILRLSQDDKENVQSSISNRYSERVLDFDEAFLQGIRPEINKMNFTQKLHFKRGVYDLLGEIFAPEMATPRASGGSSKVANEYEIASEPSISSPMTPIGQQLQLPKPTSILKKNVSFRL